MHMALKTKTNAGETYKMIENSHIKYYLCNFNDEIKLEDLPSEQLRQLWSCQWTKEQLDTVLDKYLQNNGSLQYDDPVTAFCHSIELLLIFIQNNFTGPFDQLEELAKVISNKSLLDCDPFVRLKESGEEINPNVKLGELLVISKIILEKLLAEWPDTLILHWWHLRLICIQQHIIDELTSSLYEQYKSVAELVLKTVDTVSDRELVALLYLEVANGYLLFHRTQIADKLLNELYELLKVELTIGGLLGVRTKFQQKPLPQLCLQVIQSDPNELPISTRTNGSTKIPNLLLLEDDTRLERIRFIEPKDNEIMSLPSVLQALVLAKVKLLKRSQPKDRLADEELEPYMRTLLYQESGPLVIRQSTLLLNCIQESNQRRTVERSWKQCEEIVKQMRETVYSLPERLSYAFVGFLQPSWHVEMQLCDLLISLGMTKTALDIYLRIQAWQHVIECYTRLELRHKAAEIIRQELAKKPTVLLHCLLGDATDDATCYETAWEFSKHTSGKAQAHWGNYFFARKEYAEAIPHLEKSVEINALQEKIWLRLGYSAIMLERWELAVHAYITYTHLEPLGFESWNNLAKALIKLGDKKRAHKVLCESLKCNYNNWKVWENFMVVSVDTGNFEDALNAYDRLSELKDRFLDLEVLCIVIKAIVEGRPDAKGQTSERLLKKATKLMGHQCVRHGNESKVWELAALLATTSLNKAQKLVRSYRSYTSKELSWATKKSSSLKALKLCCELCKLSLDAITTHSPEETDAMVFSQLGSARLSAQSCIRAVEKFNEKWEENEQLLAELKELLEQISTQIDKGTKK